MTKQTKNQESKPFKIGKIQFASYKTFRDFVMTSLLIIVIPTISAILLNWYVKDRTDISQLMKVVIAVGPAVVFINIIMCTYTYKAIKDPINYQVDQPLETNKNVQKGFKEFVEAKNKKMKEQSQKEQYKAKKQ